MPKGGNGKGGNGGGGGSQDPKIVDQAFTTLENPLDGTSLGFVTADVRPSKATWSIVSGNDDGAYYIDPVTGELFIGDGDAVDFEAEQTRDLIVQVTENGNKVHSATVTVNVTDVNEAPAVEAATFSVSEDETSIGTVPATDPEDDALSYAIIGGDPDALFDFDLDGNLIVADGKSLDYETTQQHVLQVEVTDTGGLSDTAEVIVNVGDVNEVPEIITAAFSVGENQTNVGTIEASDPENDTLTFALTGNGADDDKFSIDGTTGALSFTAAPDFENPTDADGDGVYEVGVSVDDGNGEASNRLVSVTLQNVLEGESFIGTPGNDTIIGTSRDDLIKGLDGADKIYNVGFGSGDIVDAGPGDDNIFVSLWGGSNSQITLGEGQDVIHVRGIDIDIVSSDANGNVADTVYNHRLGAISADGRYVAFTSYAHNLVTSGNTTGYNVFLKDTVTGSISLVSIQSDGTQPSPYSSAGSPSISADGRYVAFTSNYRLTDDDLGFGSDVFLKDTITGATTLVSSTKDGTQGATDVDNPSISADGRYVAFESRGSGLPGSNLYVSDIYLKDTWNGDLTKLSGIVSLPSGATNVIGNSQDSSISSDGRFVAFTSDAILMADDTNGVADIYLKDTKTGVLSRVSTDGDGNQGNGQSGTPSISADGRYVTFISYADNLATDDPSATAGVYLKDTVDGTIEFVAPGSSYSTISADGRYVGFTSGSDAFLKDMSTGEVTRLSTPSDGAGADGGVGPFVISADGSAVAFISNASNLVPGDDNNITDVFVLKLGEFNQDAETNPSVITVTDFTPGNDGDVVDLGDYMSHNIDSWDGSSNPFGSSGYLMLAQDGGDTVLKIDTDGGGDDFVEAIRFQNTNADEFTADNFNPGFDPVEEDGLINVSLASLSEPASETGVAGEEMIDDTTQPDIASALDATDTLNVDPNQETAYILPVPDGFDLM